MLPRRTYSVEFFENRNLLEFGRNFIRLAVISSNINLPNPGRIWQFFLHLRKTGTWHHRMIHSFIRFHLAIKLKHSTLYVPSDFQSPF